MFLAKQLNNNNDQNTLILCRLSIYFTKTETLNLIDTFVYALEVSYLASQLNATRCESL